MQELLYDALKKNGNDYRIFNALLAQKTKENKTPLSVILELSPVCNFNCQMCYVRMSKEEVETSQRHVMDFEEWKYYIDGLSDMGFLHFTLTGGESTLHPDFIQIYEYLYDLGKQVHVMTNGSSITDEILEVFQKKPPFIIVITIYGMTEETYRQTCRNNAFQTVMANIDRLLERNFIVRLQFTCCTDNMEDLKPSYEYAKSKGLPLPFGKDILNYGQCTEEKTTHSQVLEDRLNQISREVYCDMYGITEQEFDRWVYYKQCIPNPKREILTKGVICNAGRNVCTINWKGLMCPCVVMDVFSEDPRTHGGIAETWKHLNEWADNVPRIVECQNCLFSSRCHHCFALHYNDTHDFTKPSPRRCFKLRHPEEAERIQAYYDEHGELPPYED